MFVGGGWLLGGRGRAVSYQRDFLFSFVNLDEYFHFLQSFLLVAVSAVPRAVAPCLGILGENKL